jgi:hypothetical protein
MRPLHNCSARCSVCRKQFAVCLNEFIHTPMYQRPRPVCCKSCAPAQSAPVVAERVAL